jgi:hypothetical protein
MQLYLFSFLFLHYTTQPKHMGTTCIHPNQKREIGITKAAASVEKTV